MFLLQLAINKKKQYLEILASFCVGESNHSKLVL